MPLKSKVKVESSDMIAASTFYAVAGVTCFAVLAVVDFRLVHIGIIGVLSLLAAYGLFKRKVWARWMVIALFFIGTTFSVYTLYHAFRENLIYTVILGGYLFFTWIFTVNTLTKQ